MVEIDFSRVRVSSELGFGGMSIVYQATCGRTGCEFALKVLSPVSLGKPELRRRFEREMRVLQQLEHPHVAQFFGCGRFGGHPAFAMELLAGGTLGDHIQEAEVLRWEDAARLGVQICKALADIHRRGIVHRDLKPSNLLFADVDRRHLKLSDFGLALEMGGDSITNAGSTAGSYAYMAPEQISRRLPITPQTDLYALGCVLFELLAGRPPFEAESPFDQMSAHLVMTPPDLRRLALDCPEFLIQLVEWLLQKNPGDRPSGAVAVQRMLEWLHQHRHSLRRTQVVRSPEKRESLDVDDWMALPAGVRSDSFLPASTVAPLAPDPCKEDDERTDHEERMTETVDSICARPRSDDVALPREGVLVPQ